MKDIKHWTKNKKIIYFAPRSAPATCKIDVIRPNSPIALAKISIIRILTNRVGFWASARAAPEPTTPIAVPQNKFDNPTVKPAANSL